MDGKIPTQVEATSDSLDLNAILISNNEFISSKYISNAILQWISENQCVTDIRSMGEIISGKSDMAISISAEGTYGRQRIFSFTRLSQRRKRVTGAFEYPAIL